MTEFLIFYFSFNLGSVMADLVVHHQSEDTPNPADVFIELLFACPILIFFFVISIFE